MHKVLVLGLDGGSLDLIKRWKDELPNLRSFLESGLYGTLESTLPPITSPAWNCMFTGKNPAKIGFYDFFIISFDEKKIRIVNSTYQSSPFLWETLSNHNIKVCVVNVPNTFPPQKVNGLMVCGGILNVMLKDADYTYPPALREELDEVSKGYEILPLADLAISGKENEYLNEFRKVVDKQVNAVKHLMSKHSWDFFVYVFFETDQVQHYFWHYMDQNHPKWNSEGSKTYGNVIKNFYVKVDSAIGELITHAPNDTNIFIVSDHGFGPLHGYFCINEWLKEKGYMKMKSRKVIHRVKEAMMKIPMTLKSFTLAHFGRHFLNNLLRVIPKDILQRFTVRGRKKYELDRLFDDIDWSRTKAYGVRMGIFINLKGRDPKGIVEPGEEYKRLRNEIIESLRQIQHPNTGKKIVTHVFKKEQVYSGRHLKSAPDLLYVVDNMRYRPIEGVNYGRLFIESLLTGDHRLQGMFMAYGPDIRKVGKEIQNIKIYDITPTILHIFGIPIPKEIDGRVLKEIFEEGSELAKKPIVYMEAEDFPKSITKHERRVFSDKDEEKIKEKLRRLGYL